MTERQRWLNELGEQPNNWNGRILWHQKRREMGQKIGGQLPKPNSFRPKDATALFKLVGGSYHDIEIRSQFPFDPVTFPNGETYQYSDMSVGRSKRHVYVKQ